MPLNIGVLALQGDFQEHRAVLEKLGANVTEVRLPHQLEGLDGLVIPGGESTSIAKLAVRYDFPDALRRFIDEGGAVWGTCAGMIVMASKLLEPEPEPFALMDITVSRNSFGRQVDSFETDIPVDGVPGGPVHAVFIRAPSVQGQGEGVECIAKLEDGTPVAVRSGKLMATAFHPELTPDTRIHELFLRLSAGESSPV
ncbi:MAG: pyridoxal 5'-phosphate synthase glutaminase subunit PdxT [Dehalococcoidia bacterium]|nr:pyridoxal 5'-phosphate synthase glutaminase subunit PdxT [Dehalococcoidia bacterium]